MRVCECAFVFFSRFFSFPVNKYLSSEEPVLSLIVQAATMAPNVAPLIICISSRTKIIKEGERWCI